MDVAGRQKGDDLMSSCPAWRIPCSKGSNEVLVLIIYW